MVVKEGGLKLIQIQDNGTGIRVSKTSEEQAVCVLCGIYLQGVTEPFPVWETEHLWMGFLTEIFNTSDKYIWSIILSWTLVQENKVKERVA